MSEEFVWYSVYRTTQIAKKHKNWESGFVRWNTGNSKVSLFDEDKHQTLGESFIPKGPILDREYRIGDQLVQILEREDLSPAVSAVTSSSVSIPRFSSPTHRPPPVKKRVLHEIPADAPQEDSSLNSSKNGTPTPLVGHNSSVSIRKRPFAQLPFRAPAKSEVSAPIESSETTKQAVEPFLPSYSFVPPPSTPSTYQTSSNTSSNSGYTMYDWSIFETPSNNANISAGPSLALSSAESVAPVALPLASDPRLPIATQVARHSALPSEEVDIFALHSSPNLLQDSAYHREPTFQRQCTTVNLANVKGLRPPPPLPPRSTGATVSSTLQDRFLRPGASSPLATQDFRDVPPINSSEKRKDDITMPNNTQPSQMAEVRQTISASASTTPSAGSSFSKAKNIAPNSSSGKFKAPSSFNPHSVILELGKKNFCFPSRHSLASAPKLLCRTAHIDASFSSLADYRQQFTEAIFEDINLGLVPVARKFREAYARHAGSSRAPSKEIKRAISSTFRKVYFDCDLTSYRLNSHKKHSKFGHVDSGEANTVSTNPIVYLKLPESISDQEHSSAFSKDDLWIICTSPDFDPQTASEHFFFARSAMHGRPSRTMEILPLLDGPFKAHERSFPKLDGDMTVHAIHALSISADICMLDAIHDLNSQSMPLLPFTLNNKTPIKQKPVLRQSLPSSLIKSTLGDYLETYNLNEDQFSVFKRAALWFDSAHQRHVQTSPFILVHGVFGSGKSFMLVVLIMFICELFNKMEERTPEEEGSEPHKFRILVSAATNTAVDRILVGLLDQGFTDFVRVGSLKRINSRILPYSIHRDKRSSSSSRHANDFEEAGAHSTRATHGGGGGRTKDALDAIALRDLEELLRSKSLSSVEKALIEQQRADIESGSFERKLGLVESAAVVGATCISTTFPILKNSTFDIVIIDECSQIPEPLSLLPTSRFGSSGFVLVGDPLQLPPQLRSRAKNEDSEAEGLAVALFSRLSKLSVTQEPVLLRTQYRLHPALSAIPNNLFYHNRLIDGTSARDRTPLNDALPTLLFIDNENSTEKSVSNGSIENGGEARIVLALLKRLVESLEIEGSRIGVICLYKAQVELLEKLLDSSLSSGSNFHEELSSVQIATVDSFQGAEKDVIILSTCKTDSYASGTSGFVDSPFRLNVSLTRARRHLFIVGSAPYLLSSNRWKIVLNAAEACGRRSYVSNHAILSGAYFSPD